MNPTGLKPVEFNVLIEPKAVEAKIGSIIIPDATKDSEKFAQIEGLLIASSPHAFSYVTDEEWGDGKPKPGDKILYAKYAGVRVKGKDGKEYVIAKDKDVCALIEE